MYERHLLRPSKLTQSQNQPRSSRDDGVQRGLQLKPCDREFADVERSPLATLWRPRPVRKLATFRSFVFHSLNTLQIFQMATLSIVTFFNILFYFYNVTFHYKNNQDLENKYVCFLLFSNNIFLNFEVCVCNFVSEHIFGQSYLLLSVFHFYMIINTKTLQIILFHFSFYLSFSYKERFCFCQQSGTH